jgi:hypothetical protein
MMIRFGDSHGSLVHRHAKPIESLGLIDGPCVPAWSGLGEKRWRRMNWQKTVFRDQQSDSGRIDT